MRQTVVRVPLFDASDSSVHDAFDKLGPSEERRAADGQSPSHSSEEFDPDPGTLVETTT